MVRDKKVVNITGQGSTSRFFLPTALIRLRDASAQSIRTVLNQFFDRADDALFELADRASTDQEQTRYFDAMRELRLRRKSMTVAVLHHVGQAFNDIGKFRPQSTVPSFDSVDEGSLSLLDHAELEQQVAIDNMVTKLRYQYSEALRHLSLRVRHLLPGVTLEDDQVPLCPEVLCGGLAAASKNLDVDIKARLIVLKLFDQLLVTSLGEVYHGANVTLIKEGVLPDSKAVRPVQTTRSRQDAPVPPPSAVYREADGYGVGQPQAEVSAATFSQLSALLRQAQPAYGDGQAHASGGQWLQTDALLARLSQVQAAFSNDPGAPLAPLNQQLQTVLQNSSGQSLRPGQVDNDVINLVAMLFEFILDDRHLHSVMKSLLGRLQIPILKVALTDKNFFNRGGHPARKLLNEMALAATGWTEKRPGQRDPLLDKISAVVNRILAEFSTDVSLFNELLDDFSQYSDLDQRRSDLVEQRLRDAEEGRARHEQAIADAKELLHKAMDGRLLPEPVQDMLNGPWSHYLHWLALHESTDSKAWQRAKTLTEQLIWTIDPVPLTATTHELLQQTIPQVIEQLRGALEGVAWDGLSVEMVIRDLELVHLDVFQRLVITPSEAADNDHAQIDDSQESLADRADAVPSVTTETSAGASHLAPALPVAADDPEEAVVARLPEPEVAEPTRAQPVVAEEWLAKADGLRVGCWLELNRDGSQIRCKLAAFIRAVDKYIFVNRSGAKVAEYRRNELAEMMAQGHIQILDDGLIFDRALESIIDSLRTSRRF
ncbi:MAG: DUF1631 domain-containing protein [Marinobacter psychrophilus]|nr:DUF1631 domain-containing protein [Marinobacter psychrophilus]MBQ0761553.1 DUF1631 domain-containing protein [Marinobacter psychrophilus]MBQ0845829.1 DUF1631 domain-containing protein [Marinobacter psychrophilus]